MPTPTNPLAPLRQAHEEDYFRKRNQELVEKMRQTLRQQKEAAELAAETGVADEALLEKLASLGVTRETAPLLPLMPLLQVAWADGEIQDAERKLLEKAADEAGLTEGPAREAFDRMLDQQPEAAFFDGALNFIREMVEALPAEEAQRTCEDLTDLSWQVADASGGIFGMFLRVEDPEKRVLYKIAEHLSTAYPEATKKLLERVR